MDQELLLAARRGSLRRLNSVLKRASPDTPKSVEEGRILDYVRAIHVAARHGHHELVKHMIGLNPSLAKSLNENDETPLHVAARCGHVRVVQTLIELARTQRNAAAAANNNNNSTASTPPQSTRWEDAEEREEGEGDIICGVGSSYAEYKDAETGADKDGDDDDDDECWEDGEDGDEDGEEDWKDGEETEMEEEDLLAMKDNENNTAMHSAVKNGKVKIVELLAKEDPELLLSPNLAEKTPLSIAIEMKFSDIACKIIDTKPDSLRHLDYYEQTPLHCAVKNRDTETVKMILKHRNHIDLVERTDKGGRNCLHHAAALGYHEIVKLLSNDISSLAYKSEEWDKRTPVHLAAINGRVNILKEFYTECQDAMERTDDSGRNIFHLAAINGNLNVVVYLLRIHDLEDLMSAADDEGNTPLHLAAKHLRSRVAYVLSRNKKVQIGLKNNDRKTPLDLVRSSNHSGMEKHLTLKALKRAYAKRGINPDDTMDNRIRGLDETIKPVDYKTHREMARTLSVMSTLIATFTFTAAFTLPGGLKNDGPDEGTATLLHNTAFKAFVITDTVAMTSSMTAAVLVFWSLSHNDEESFWDLLPFAMGMTWIGLVGMSLAFITGLFAVLSKTPWLAITVCFVGCASPVVLYMFAPFLLILFDLLFSSAFRQRDMVDNNPFVFVFRLVKAML